MSIQLRLVHEDGIRLRQQTATKVERIENVVDGKKVEGGAIKSGTDWKFERYQLPNGQWLEEAQQDEDPRRVGSDGKKIKLGTYTLHITTGLRNLVVERKGKVAPFNFRNSSIRNQIRRQYQKLTETGRKTKEGKAVFEWKNDGPATYVPPNTFDGVFVGDGQRAILDEMPT